MPNWYCSFTDLRVAGVPLTEWMEHHRQRRAMLTPEERRVEEQR